MVFYECLISTKHTTHFKALSGLMKQVSLKIVDNGGIVRSIQNNGIRQFPHRVQAKYPDFKTGQRYFEKGRYISMYYDANPATLREVSKIFEMNDEVLRNTHLKARSKLDWISMQRPEKNPYVQRVLRQDEQTRQNRQAEDFAIATATTSGDMLVENLIDNMKDDA